MSNEEAIKILEVAAAEVEWNCPLDYQMAIKMAISALERVGKFDTTIDSLIAECKKAPGTLWELMEKCLMEDGHGASPTGSISAYAYFDQQRQIYEYMIPTIIESYLDTGKVRREFKGEDNDETLL